MIDNFKNLKAPKIHGFSFAGRMAGPKGKHDHWKIYKLKFLPSYLIISHESWYLYELDETGRMAGQKGKHDHWNFSLLLPDHHVNHHDHETCEQRINNEIDPVGRVPTAAAFVEAAFVNLVQVGWQ